MIEHRLIERLIAQIRTELDQITSAKRTDPVRIDTFVDFIKTYADRTHHGKEEDIYFKKLGEKPMSEEDSRVMDELIEEHRYGRKITGELVEANARYRDGDANALSEISEKLKQLVAFYPGHIEKEDKVFFPNARSYFSDDDQRALLDAFYDFDRRMIHEKYEKVARKLKES
jgi:hemerythrin-like domain-containing protein